MSGAEFVDNLQSTQVSPVCALARWQCRRWTCGLPVLNRESMIDWSRSRHAIEPPLN